MNRVKQKHKKIHEESYPLFLIWLEKMRATESWDLSMEQACLLLGGITTEAYRSQLNDAINDKHIRLNFELIERSSLLLGIHKAISLSTPMGYEQNFFIKPNNNKLFSGRSAKELILEDPSINTLSLVKSFFNSKI